MAELDATQMPEEITPSAEVNTTDLNTTEDTSPDLNTVEEPAVDQEPQGKPVSKEELAKRYLPKARTAGGETSKIQTVAEPASTAVEKPVAVKPKSKEGKLLLQTQEEADKEAYNAKKLESQLSLKPKKGDFKLDAKRELEDFLGGKIGSIDWNAYDKSKLQEEREAIKAKIEKDVDPNYDPSGVLTFINMITPNALKSGVASMGSQLAGFAGAAAQYIDKASKQSVTGGAFGETTPEKKAAQTTTVEDLYKSLYNTAASLDKKSQDYMMVAELNSGIKEKNVGKGAYELLSSNNPGDTWDGLKKLGLSVTQQIPQLIALAATGGSSAGIMAGSTVLGTGGAITQEYKKDQDISVADAWKSVAKGIIEGATETLFMGDIKALRSLGVRTIKLDMSGAKKTMSDYLKERGRKALEQEINRTYFQGIRTIFKNSIGEGGEEILASVGGFIVDRIQDGKWNQEEYDKLIKETQEAFLVGAATGFAASSTALATSVTPLTTEQKRKIISFRQIANDETVDKDVRALAKKHADDIVNYSADLATRKYSILSSLPIEKRKVALSIENKIKGLEESKPKLKDVGAEEQVDKDIAKLKEDWSKVVVEHAVETAKADAKAKAEKIATAPKVMTSNSTEISTATEAMEVDPSMVNADFGMLKGLSIEQKQTLVNVQKAMQTINPDGKVTMYASEAEMRQGLINSGLSEKEAYERAASSSAQLTYRKDGSDPIVHVNLSNTTDAVRSASHEIAHLALMELSKTDPEAFVAMRDSVLRIMKNSQAKPLIDFASRYSAKLETTEAKQERAEEFLVEMIGALTSGEGKIERTVLDQWARIMRDFLLKASRSLGNKNLEDFINKTFADTTSSEALANYFESLAKQLKVGGKIDVSTLSDVIPLTPAQEARLQGLTPGTDAYHQAAMTNAVENSPSAARPTMEADQSLVQNPDDVVSRSQLAESNFIESPQFKKYLKVVKGMTPQDVWLGRALFMDENRGGKMFASGTKEEIIEQMKKEMDQIEADANNSNKYYITELKPPYIAAQIAKFEKDPALTDNLTEWKMIRDDASMRERYIKEKAAEQKASLTGNIAYLKGNDTYDVAFQYAMIKDGISSRYTVVPATEPGGDSQIQRDSIKPSQLNSTEKPIITMQPGIVASAYADYGNYNTEPGRGYLVAQINMPKIEVTASEFAPFIFKQSDTGEGTWLKFNQSSNKEDAKPLFKIASTSHKYPAQWCTGGALSTAEGHLRGGDFYIFVDAKTGDARIAVRYNGKNQISEVRGLGDGQSVLPEDGDIIDELVNTLPGGKEYKKDAEVQNTLKKILDSLPDEFSRKKFALNYDDFNFWLRDQKVGTDEDERKIRIETGKNIKDAVIKIANDSFGSAQDAIDLINIKDKSYGQKNYALKNTKDVILNNVDDVFGNLGYEKGSVEKGFVAKDTITDTSKVRLILNDLYISDNEFPDFEYKFPLLENVTGKIVFDNKVYDNPIKVKASFPLLKNVKELKFDTVGDTDVKFDSLENIGEFGIKSNYKTETKIDFPKLKTIDSKENFVIHNKANVNAPLLEKISIGAPSSYTPGVLLITGDLNAPSLKTIDAKLEVYTDTDNLFKGKKKSFTFDNLESVAGLESVDANLSLPKLKYTGSILADNSSIKLNDISFDNIASFMASILANNNSYISINEISFNNEGGKGYKTLGIESQRGSEIVINNVTRQFGFSLTQGINSLKASEASQITILKGADQSWSDVEIESESAIKLPGVNKLKNVTLRNVRFSTNANEISKLTATNSEVTLPNAKNLFQFTLIDGGFIKAPNLKLLSEVSLFNITDNNNDKFDFGDFRSSGGSIELHNSELTIPNFTSTSNIFINNGRLSLPNATSIYGNVELAGGELSVPSMIRFRAAEKPIKMSYGSILNAPLLNSTTQQFELVGENTQSIQIFAPKLGYNGTSTPDPTLAKSQLAKDIETLDKAIQSVRMSPTVKYWMEPEFAPESQGIPKKGTPATVVFGKKDNPEGVSDFVAYYAENGNLVSVLNMLTQPKPGSESSKGAFKITVDPAQRRKGYAKLLLDAAQNNGLDIIGNVKNNRFSATGKDLVADWIKAKKQMLIDQKNDLSTTDEKATEAAQSLAKASGTTQVATTTGSYEKAAKILKSLNVTGDVLDYGAGLGLGTDAMSKVLGTDVKSYDINPERWKGKGSVTYTNAKDINKRFDGIVSLNVVNVVPKDIRDFVVTNIFDNLNIGGTAIISSRKFKGDIDQTKEFELGSEEKSYIVKRKQDGKTVDVFQKGYDGDELVDYVKGLLGDAATVKKNNTFGAAGVVITKNAELPVTTKSQLAPNGKPSNLTKAQYETVRTPEFKAWFGDWENDPENASKFVDENGEPQVFYHGTYADFERFSTDPELKRFSVHNRGIFFTPTVTGAKSYGDIQMPVFLNAKTVDYNTADINNSFKAEREKENNLIDNTDKEGVVLKTIDKESITVGDKDGMVKQYVVFDPNQILLAGDKTYAKSQLADPMLYLGAYGDQKTYVPGTSSAKEAEAKANKPQSVKEVIQLFEKEFTERNVHLADFMKNADMMQSMYNMYNKAGATPWATRMFAEAYRDVYGKVKGKGLSKRDKGFLDDVILLRRVIAIDENFDNRKEPRPKHTSFDDYETKKKVQLSKEEALKQLDLLKTKVYANNPAKFDELVHRSEKYFEAFSGILKFKLDNGIITQDEYDMYKNYNYQPRKFLKFILADTKPEAFNTRGIQIKQDEFKNIQSGDEGYMMTDSEQLLKMGFVSAVNQVFSNRAKVAIFNELAGRDLGWAKPAKVDTYANGTPKLNPDGSPKLLEPNTGYRNITFKVDGKRNAFQMKESLAREFEDTELWNTQNRFYKFMVALMGAKLTSAMAVGISPAFILTNIPTDVFSQVHVNNLFNSRFGAPGQLVKGFAGTLAKSLEIAKAKTGLGDNSRILNLINDYGKLGGLQNTLSYDTNILGKVGDALGMLGDISELASKLNAFEKRRAGLLKDFIKKNKANPTAEEYEKIEMQAAYEARAAMDFNRGGRVTKFMNAFLPFLNVGAQATKLTTSYVKNHFPAFTKKIMQAGLPYMGLTLYNLMVAGDDWENEDLKRDKKNKIIIMSPYKNADGTHSYTKLQIPAAIKVFFNVFSIIAENIYYSQIAPAQGVKVPAVDKSMTKEMIDNLKMFVPAVKSTLMPPSAKFFSEYSNNESIFNERSLSQDALRKIIITEEGEENPDVLSLYKVLAKNTAQITKDTWMSEMGMIGRDGIEVSPERFQKAAEDSWFTSPESQALLSTMYLVADQMTNFVVGGVDEKLRSKYLGNGDYAGVMEAWAKSFKNRLIGKTDKKKNEFFYDMKEDMEMIESAQRKENSLHQDIAYKLKDIFKSYKALDLPYISAKPEVMEFYKSIKDPKDKEYAKNYIEMMIGNSQVELVNNIPKYRLILKEAKSARTKATAIYAMFTMRGQDPMTDKVLQKDLAKMGFSGEVVKQYKKIAKMEEAKKGVDVSDNIDPKTGLPPGFNPEDYK